MQSSSCRENSIGQIYTMQSPDGEVRLETVESEKDLGVIIDNIYIFIAIALDESIFLDVLHFPMKNIKSRDLEATPMGGATSKPIQ